MYPKEHAGVAKQVWQHTGEGISSRRSEFCLKALLDGFLVEDTADLASEAGQKLHKGPRRYQKHDSTSSATKSAAECCARGSDQKQASESLEFEQFIEERFGRNLSPALANDAKLAVRRRISGSLTASVDPDVAPEPLQSHARVPGLTENHVYLFPSGMSAIFNAHQILMSAKGLMKSICFGFPYIDTLKILQKWGPGALFYGHGSLEELDDLERRLKSGERYLALFTEFPGNPLLKTPDLERIWALANQYDFAVVVDDSLGNFINVNLLSHADVVVSSLTKIFSGDSNVMGGSAVLNPNGKNYQSLKNVLDREYEDNYWAEDAIFLERNSRDFVSRIERINASTETLTSLLQASPLGKLEPSALTCRELSLTTFIVKSLYYPKYSPTRPLYDKFRNPNGGYGGLFSVTFHSTAAAVAFFDALSVMKGPSLGTNFTLRFDSLCPLPSLSSAMPLTSSSVLRIQSSLITANLIG
jgi:cystathionine gamma-synthase